MLELDSDDNRPADQPRRRDGPACHRRDQPPRGSRNADAAIGRPSSRRPLRSCHVTCRPASPPHHSSSVGAPRTSPVRRTQPSWTRRRHGVRRKPTSGGGVQDIGSGRRRGSGNGRPLRDRRAMSRRPAARAAPATSPGRAWLQRIRPARRSTSSRSALVAPRRPLASDLGPRAPERAIEGAAVCRGLVHRMMSAATCASVRAVSSRRRADRGCDEWVRRRRSGVLRGCPDGGRAPVRRFAGAGEHAAEPGEVALDGGASRRATRRRRPTRR